MKEITIFQENNPPILFTDEDKSDIVDYRNQLLNLLEAKNVVVLETSSGSIIIRPHTINSIKVTEIFDSLEPLDNSAQEVDKNEEQIEKIEEPQEDVITDGE